MCSLNDGYLELIRAKRARYGHLIGSRHGNADKFLLLTATPTMEMARTDYAPLKARCLHKIQGSGPGADLEVHLPAGAVVMVRIFCVVPDPH